MKKKMAKRPIKKSTGKSRNKVMVDCMNSDPATFDCSNPDWIACVVNKHSKSKDEHNGMVLNSAVSPRVVYLEGLSLPQGECGQYLVKITFNPAITDSNEDISVSIVNWPAKKIKKDSRFSSVDVYYSVILFNALANDPYWIETIEMRKATEDGTPSGEPTVVIKCKNSSNMTKYYGNLTNMNPLSGTALP